MIEHTEAIFLALLQYTATILSLAKFADAIVTTLAAPTSSMSLQEQSALACFP